MTRGELAFGNKNPADMNFRTLTHYYYDTCLNGGRNWVFPVVTENQPKRSSQSCRDMDSRPFAVRRRNVLDKMEEMEAKVEEAQT